MVVGSFRFSWSTRWRHKQTSWSRFRTERVNFFPFWPSVDLRNINIDFMSWLIDSPDWSTCIDWITGTDWRRRRLHFSSGFSRSLCLSLSDPFNSSLPVLPAACSSCWQLSTSSLFCLSSPLHPPPPPPPCLTLSLFTRIINSSSCIAAFFTL